MVGWLSVTPDGSEIQRRDMSPHGLPEIDPAESIIDDWRDLGLCGSGMNGPLALTWLEVDAYARLQGGEKPAIFWATLREMSVAYVNAINDTSPLSIPPIKRGKHG